MSAVWRQQAFGGPINPTSVIKCRQEDLIGEGWQNVEALSVQNIINLALAAVVAVLAFRASINRLKADFASAEQPPIHPTTYKTD